MNSAAVAVDAGSAEVKLESVVQVHKIYNHILNSDVVADGSERKEDDDNLVVVVDVDKSRIRYPSIHHHHHHHDPHPNPLPLRPFHPNRWLSLSCSRFDSADERQSYRYGRLHRLALSDEWYHHPLYTIYHSYSNLNSYELCPMYGVAWRSE